MKDYLITYIVVGRPILEYNNCVITVNYDILSGISRNNRAFSIYELIAKEHNSIIDWNKIVILNSIEI